MQAHNALCVGGAYSCHMAVLSAARTGAAGAVAVSGVGGLIGSALAAHLSGTGRRVVRIVRGALPATAAADDSVACDVEAGVMDAAALEGVEAVVHLAGAPIVGRWTNARRRRIEHSRTAGTQLISRALAGLKRKPGVLVVASAIGIYGDRGDEVLTESSPAGAAGDGFLRFVCQQWELATAPASAAGIRVVHLRLGMVLALNGGALSKMLTPFRIGLGGVVGTGEQWVSWIHLDDVVRVIECCLADERLSGPVNAVTPHPVTNRQFTRALGRALHRPTLAPLPAFVLRLLLGEVAEQILLASARVQPVCLQGAGFQFQHAHLEAALGDLLGR